MMAGYSLIYRRTFKVGDRVKINDVVGDVVEMRLQVTHLRTIKNEDVIIPNSVVLTSQVVPKDHWHDAPAGMSAPPPATR
jgi:small-conductance mechanosensitive channel